jgi:YHS domain-containing protein
MRSDVCANPRKEDALLPVLRLRKISLSVDGGTMVTDPVCSMEIDEVDAKFQALYAGRKYYFCSEECKAEFEDRPEEYATASAA